MKPKFKIPKLTGKQIQAIDKSKRDKEIIFDTIEVCNTITDILIGALIDPDRDPERWTRARIREALTAGTLKRYRTYEILRNAQRKASAFEWLRYYWLKFELTKAEDGSGHLQGGKIVWVDYAAPVESNI